MRVGNMDPVVEAIIDVGTIVPFGFLWGINFSWRTVLVVQHFVYFVFPLELTTGKGKMVRAFSVGLVDMFPWFSWSSSYGVFEARISRTVSLSLHVSLDTGRAGKLGRWDAPTGFVEWLTVTSLYL